MSVGGAKPSRPQRFWPVAADGEIMRSFLRRGSTAGSSPGRPDIATTPTSRNQPGPPIVTNANPVLDTPRLTASRAGAMALLALLAADVPLRAEEAVLTA